MLRNIAIASALFAFATVAAAGADCSDSHGAKGAITEDQAQATQVPVKAAALPAAKKSLACEGNCADKSAKSQKSAPTSVAVARNTAPPAEKPSN